MKTKLILLLFIPFALSAQNNTRDTLHQYIITSAIKHINQYESSSSFAYERNIDNFKSLFVDNATLACDIPPRGNYNEIVTLENYVAYTRSYYGGNKRLGVNVEINEFSNINFIDNSRATFSVFITKSVYGKNAKNGITVEEKQKADSGKDTLVMEDYYPEYIDTFQLELKFTYNNGLKIEKIELLEPKSNLLVVSPHFRKVTQRLRNVPPEPIFALKLNIDGKKVQVYDYFYSITDLDENSKIVIEPMDRNYMGREIITLKTFNKVSDGNVYKLDFTKTIGDVKAFALFRSSISLNSNDYNASIVDNSSISYGGDISFNIDDIVNQSKKAKRNKRMSLYIKAGVVMDAFDYTLSIPSLTYFYDDIDSDGGEYVRTVLLTNYEETQKLDMQTIFAQLEVRINSKSKNKFLQGGFSIAGGMGQVTVNSATYGSSSDALFSGYYENLYGLTIAENGVYNFGDFSGTNNLQTNEGTDLVYNSSIQTIMASASLIYSLEGFGKYIPFLNSRHFVEGGVMYTGFQSNIFDIGSDRIAHEKGQQPNELNTMNNILDVNMNSLAFRLALCIKF